MTRCAGWQGTGFAWMVAGRQEPLDAARSVCAIALARGLRLEEALAVLGAGGLPAAELHRRLL
ncbi:hypothetical protein [Streptomyces griseoruber]|uniref:Uncharacterized protein n=1 Tax=Streptomyces griseoruber TaxID=1943 RepID=A0A101SMB0_9ACTN|nr:hypothetical protein [Streptomyces griseoruber]KUN76567.1 hypothetical protein AQJ64_36970 [Streptomyces griseoruber]